MNSVKYVGLDVHQSTISAAVLEEDGKLVMQCVVVTRAAAILDFMHGLRGTLHLTFEEGAHAAWLYDLLARRVAKLVVCNPRKNALLKSGSKSDAIDARKLAELLRGGQLSPVYHGERSALAVQHLARSYGQLTEDTTRVMGRLKAVLRGQAIVCAGKKPYGKRHREPYLRSWAGAACGAAPSTCTRSWTLCKSCAGCWHPEQIAAEPSRGRTTTSMNFLSGSKRSCW
jgi:hypothetical protein